MLGPGVADRLPTMRNLDTDAWTLPGAEILQLAFEVPRATAALLPKAMHPAIPPYATIWVIHSPRPSSAGMIMDHVQKIVRYSLTSFSRFGQRAGPDSTS